MALEEYVGAVILELDGREIDCARFSVNASNGKRPVRTMNRLNRVKGFSSGMMFYEISIDVVIPADGDEPNWLEVEGAKLTREPIGGGKRVSYLDVVVTSQSESFEVEGEARRSLSAFATREVTE